MGIEWNPIQWEIPQTLTKQLFDTLHNEFHTNKQHQFIAMQSLSYSTHESPLKSIENININSNAHHQNQNKNQNEEETTKTMDNEENEHHDIINTDDMVRDNDDNSMTISSGINASNLSTPTNDVSTKFMSQKYTTEEIMNVMKLLMTEAPF